MLSWKKPAHPAYEPILIRDGPCGMAPTLSSVPKHPNKLRGQSVIVVVFILLLAMATKMTVAIATVATLMLQGLLSWLVQGGFKVSSGTASWYGSSHGTDLDISGMASPVMFSD